MKIKKLIYLSIFIFLLFIYNSKSTLAHSLPSWEFYPEGINYFSKDFITIETNDDILRYKISRFIKVKPSEKYSLDVFVSDTIVIKNVYFNFYDLNKELVTKFTLIDANTTYKSFMTQSNTYYISGFIEFIILDELYDYKQIDEVLAFYEGDKITVNNYDDFLYQGPKLEINSVYTQNRGSYVQFYNYCQPLDDILKHIKAYDDYDGDITDNIEVVVDNYTENRYVIGKHLVKLKVSDSSGNESFFDLIIDTYDVTPPEFYGTTEMHVKQNYLLQISDILYNYLDAFDNYDGVLTDKIEVYKDNYSDNYTIEGDYDIIFKVADSSGNEAFHTMTIIVRDTTPPVISGPSNLTFGITEGKTVEYFKSLLSAYDDVDGDISDKIQVVTTNYFDNIGLYGEFFIKFKVSDMAGNIGYHIINIEIIDDVPPIFLINSTVINIDLNYSDININNILEIFTRMNGISSNSVSIINDEFSEHNNRAGQYNISFEVEDIRYDLKVNVISDKESQNKSKVNWFRRVLIKINNLFKKVIIKKQA